MLFVGKLCHLCNSKIMHNCSLQILRPMRDQISDHGYNTSYFQLTGASYIYSWLEEDLWGGDLMVIFFLGGGEGGVNRVLEGDSTNFVNLTANQGESGRGLPIL